MRGFVLRLGAGMALAALIAAGEVLAAAGPHLIPFKDSLFALPKATDSQAGGAYLTVPFDADRDVKGRDEVPNEKAKADYVSLDIDKEQTELTFAAGSANLKYLAVGKTAGKASVIVVYLHGWQADRSDGFNDWKFGGNFNRLKNLVARSGGVYVSPDFPSSPAAAVPAVKGLIADLSAKSPGAPVFVICASLGGRLCWQLAEDPAAVPRLGGILLIAAAADPAFLKSAAIADKSQWVPIYLGTGSHDSFVKVPAQAAFFNAVKKAYPDYPIQLTVFDGGQHGTAYRMTDWRTTINWMIDADARLPKKPTPVVAALEPAGGTAASPPPLPALKPPVTPGTTAAPAAAPCPRLDPRTASGGQASGCPAAN